MRITLKSILLAPRENPPLHAFECFLRVSSSGNSISIGGGRGASAAVAVAVANADADGDADADADAYPDDDPSANDC